MSPSKTRRNHSSAFKLKVALAALKEERTMSELCKIYGLHESVIRKWKNKLQDNGSLIFDQDSVKPNKKSEENTSISTLHEAIGKLTVENNFLKKALDA